MLGRKRSWTERLQDWERSSEDAQERMEATRERIKATQERRSIISGTCTGCDGVLVMDMDRKCWSCGHRAGLIQSASGVQTFTLSGAIKVLTRHQAAVEKRIKQDMDELVEQHPSGEIETIYAAAGLLHGMTWQQAERYVCGWMQNTSHYEDAQLTSPGADDGIDIVCDEAIAQVKHHQTAVGIAEVQRMLGIAAALNKQALFFSASGYTPKATIFAARYRIACYTYPPVREVN
ncbi:hypothetical protein GTV32_22770 [Gordonia sp. SID5947]|uniref:restriction endonuclease n=1 Tax=Gordonia sp. SID5947 TaxID=2690315 RepID=UPI0013689DE8|nr:restriction endonuclease [Gordonia sp. SID5947]MYR08961.1 hypothetical protein [Gordonia sp. SID5947]